MSRFKALASRWIAVCAPLALLAWSAAPIHAQSAAPQRVLGREEIVLYGIGLKVEPGFQTVPKDIATIVGTFLQAPVLPNGLPPFAASAEVVATLRGPSFQSPVELRVKPNTPFNIPALTVPGAHVLENIRLMSGGEVLLRGTPDHVTIDVIEKLLVTQVSARALTASEIRERGIVFDASNFQAYNFSAAFAIGDAPVNLNFPIVLPRLDRVGDVTPADTMLGAIPMASLPTLSTIIPDTLKIQAQIPNLSVVGFTLKTPALNGQKFVVPPIPGVVVIPGDIGFLNQYFSVMLLVGNVAPGGSNLVVTNLKAEIVLPPGNDQVANSSDDPLRMAQTARGESLRLQLVAQPGADGKVGTADDITSIGPGESGNAEYLVEGRREGSHVVEMQITGTLEGLPIGPVTVNGRAAGSVLVRNPKFTLTFTHPEVVSAGEPYTLDVTVTNTSAAPANFVSINLYPRNVTGATIAGDPSRGIDSLAPGDSTTVTFNLISKKTGKVTAATLDSDENVAGRFSLKAAVGELGVPLSPDSLVLPREANGLRVPGDNPDDLKQAALGLLGKAHAVATAPAAALPADVRRFSRKIVIDRAIQVAEAGLRVSMNEPLPVSASQLFMDFMGSDVSRLAALFPKPSDQQFERDNFEGFDELRRRSVRGDQFAAAAGRAMAPSLVDQGGQSFLNGLAQGWSYRPNHVSVLVTGNGQPLPARFSLADAQGRRVGSAGPDGKVVKDIPFSDVVDFTNASGQVLARLIVLAAPQPGEYQIDAAPGAGAPINAGYLVSIVAPDSAGALRQTTSPTISFPQRPATMGVPGDPYVFTFAEFGGATIDGAQVLPIVDPGPTVISVIQQAQADALKCGEEVGVPLGRIVAVLFSEEVTPASVQDRLAASDITAFGVDSNRVVGVALQPGRRVAFLALRDPYGPFVPRQITVSGVTDMRGNAMSPWTGPMQATVPDDGAVVSGRILNADGTPVPLANARLFSLFSCGQASWVGVSSKSADADGRYQFDYVTKLLSDRILAINQETGESRSVRFDVQRNGQRLNIDVVFLGRGTFAGTTFDERGKPLAGTALRVTSLTDGSEYGATTDAAGRFSVPGVPVGNFFIEAVNVAARAEFSFTEHMPGASITIARDITLLDVAERDVTVKHGAVSGHVLRADGVTPVAAVPVAVWYRDQSQPGVLCPGDPRPLECPIAMTTSDGQGAFAFAKVAAGELRLATFDQWSLSQGSTRVILAPDGTAEANVLLSGGLGTVNGIVQDAAQNPVAGARVGGGLTLTTTGADGRFSLIDVPVGRHAIVAVSDALGSRGEMFVDIVQAGQVVNAAITLAPVGSVSGNVVLADGLTPVPNVDVYVFQKGNGTVSVVGTTRTDANGGFRIASVPAGAYDVSAFNASFTDGNIVPATVKFQGQVFRTTIRFRGAGGRIVGKVFDNDGQTPLKATVGVSGDQLVVAGGRVGVDFQRVNYFQVVDTDITTGAFAFNNIWVGDVTVSAIGQFSPDPISVEAVLPAPNSTVTVNLQLQSTSQIRGVVFLPNGVQPAGANVIVKYKADEFKIICSGSGDDQQCESIPQGIQEENVVTDAQGRFWVPIVTAGSFTLTVEDPSTGKLGTIKGHVKPGEVANMPVRLLGTGDVTIKVLGSNGVTPIPGARIEVRQLGYPQKTVTLTADATGTLQLTGGDALVEGAFVVTATDPVNGFAGRASGKVALDGEQVLVKVFLYNAAGTVSGTVFGPNGFTPVPNADVILSGPLGPLSYGVTDGGGRYTVASVPLGAVTIDIFEARTGRRGAASGRVDADGQQVTINVVEAAIGLVKGQVLRQSTLEPLKGWAVGLSQQSSSGLSLPALQTTTGVDGAYSFPGASRGTFTVSTANAEANAAASARGAIEREGQVVDVPILVNITRRLSGGITGTVVDAAGAPAGSASLEFCLPDRCVAHNLLQTTAAADGSFVVSDIALGRFSVVARSQTTGDSGSVVGDVLFDGDVATVTIVMSGLAKVSGQVVRANGSPAADVQVSLKAYPSSGCVEDCVQSTDGSGQFTFLNVPGRTFTVTAVDLTTGLNGVAGGSLNPGEQKTLRIVLEPTAAISGRVLRSSGIPAHAAVAELILDGSGPERRLYRETRQDGTFDFSAVPLTQYTLVLTDPLGSGIARRQGTLVGPLVLGDIVLDEAPPQVASLIPAPASRGVALNSDVVITFTEPIQPGTINPENVTLLGPAGPILATLDVKTNDTVVVLHPLSDLKDETVYTVRVNNVKDRVQKLMAAPYVATFTTVDVTRPTVIEASPAGGSRGVTIYTPIRLKFSEAIDTAKFNGAAISLMGPGGAVAGASAYLFGNTVAVFTPNLPLAEGATYQVSVKKATDLAGLEQATALSYAFTTTSRTPPTLSSLVAANNGLVIDGGVGRVIATPGPDSDVVVVDFYVNGTLAGADRIAPFELAFQATPQLGGPGAIVTVTAIPTDSSGNRGVVPATAQLTIVADRPPAMTLAVTTPTGTLAARNGDRIVVALRATDDVGVTQLGYRAVTGNPLDAQNKFYAPVVLDQAESFAFHIPANAAPGSTVAVQGSAIDTKGQVVQATPVEVTVVDAVLPAVQITGATTGATLRPGQSTTVLVTADDLGGITQVTFTAGGLVIQNDSRPVNPAQNAVVTSFTVTVPATARPGQTLTLDATATDRAGNIGTAARVILPIADGIAPTASLRTASGSLAAAPGQTLSVIVGGEDEGLLSELRLSAAGAMTFADAKQVTPPNGSASRAFELLIPGDIAIGAQIQLTATAVDLGGNVSAPATLTLTVVSTIDLTLPASLIVKAGTSADVTVLLGQPAPAGGVRIDFATDHGGVATVAPSVTFGAGESSKTVAIAGVAAGTTTLRALYQGVERASMTIAVSGGNVTGVVLDSQLRPVAGAQLTVSGGVSVNVTSGADGTYVAEGIPGPAVTVKALDPVSRLRGYATGTMNAQGGSLALSVVLIPAGAVDGTVFLADGTTPAGANVRVDILDTSRRVLGTVFTDDDSRYAFPLVTLGQYTVQATAIDGNRGSAALTLFESGQDVTLPIVYLGFGTLTGAVRNGANAPVPNAALTLRTWDVFGAATPIVTNADQLGNFAFDRVPVGSFSLEARDQATGQAGSIAGTIQRHQDVVEQDVIIASFGAIHGTVFRFDGTTPVAGAQVVAGGHLTTTNESGQYRFDILPLGSYLVRATETATRSVGVSSATIGANGQDITANITFAGQGRLLVTVRDAGGAVVPSAYVQVTINGSQESIDGTTGADGTALVDHVPVGLATVVARSGPLAGQASNIPVAPGALVTVTVTLQATGQITGTVYEPNGQTPASAGTVRLIQINSREVAIGPDGQYRFELVPQGDHLPMVFDANARLRAVSKTNATITSNGQVITRDFTMVGLANVTGRVVFSDGSSAQKFPVTLRSTNPDFGSVTTVTTDAAGNYVVADVPIGAFLVSAADPVRQLLGEAAGAITLHGKDETADIVLQNNAITLPRLLYDGNAFDFTVRRDGQFSTNPAYGSQLSGFGAAGGGSILEIVASGVTRAFQGDPISTIEDSQREVATRESGLHGLNVTRKIAVPGDGYFTRELELLTNPGTTPITVDVRITSRLRSGNPLTAIVASSSGDTTFSATDQNPDNWVVFREGRIGNLFLPSRAFVVGSGGTVPLGLAQVAGAADPVTLTYGWTSLTVQPGQTVGLLHFIAHQTSDAAALASAARLVQLPPEALQGLSPEEIGQIVNFQVPVDGRSALAPLPALKGTVSGRVFDSDTPATPTPLSPAVTFESASVLYRRSFSLLAAADGRFSFTTIATEGSGKRLIPQEPFTLRAIYPRTEAASPIVSGTFLQGSAIATADVVFSNTGIIIGTVRRANGTAVQTGTVEISGGPFRFSVSIANGAQFRFAGLPPATYTLKAFVSTPGGAQLTTSTQVSVTAGATSSGDMTLPQTFVVNGSVLRPSGAGVSGAFVTLQGPISLGVNTSTGGAFSFADVPPGSYTLRTTEPGTGIQTTESVVIVDASVTRNLILIAVGSVSGTVSLVGGAPASDRMVQMEYTRPGGQRQTLFEYTNSTGLYRFAAVPVSTFTLTVNDTSAHLFGTASGQLQTDGENVIVNFSLDVETVNLPATLYDANGFQFTFDRSGVSNAGAFRNRAAALGIYTQSGIEGFDGGELALRELGGRQLKLTDTVGSIAVTRKIFVPSRGYFTRFVETFHNPTAAPLVLQFYTADVLTSSWTAPTVVRTSSGDAVISATGDDATRDRWAIFDDPLDLDPFIATYQSAAVGSLWSGIGAARPPDALEFTAFPSVRFSGLYNRWNAITLQPGETYSVMHFLLNQTSVAAAQASLERLAQLPDEAIEGLTAEDRASIRNFVVPPVGTSSPLPPLPGLEGTVQGHVYGSVGDTPLNGVEVLLTSTHPIFARSLAMTTSTDGVFTFSGSFTNPAAPKALAIADYTLTGVTPDTRATVTAIGTFAPGETTSTTDLRLTQVGGVTGILRRSNGAALAGVEVRDYFGRSQMTAPDGRFTFLNYPPGGVTLFSTLPFPPGQFGENIQGSREYTVTVGALAEGDLVFPPTGSLQGIVTAANGSPAVETTVYAYSPNGYPYWGTTTDGQGRYRIDDLPVGSYRVEVYEPRTGRPTTATVAVAAGVTSTQDLRFVAIGSLTVTVNLGSGLPAANAAVSIDPSGDQNWQSQTLTGTNGQAVIANVSAGTFAIRVSHPLNPDLYVFGQATLSTEGENVQVTITLPQTGTVTGVLRNGLGTKLNFSTVQLQEAVTNRVLRSVTTDGSGTGSFTFSGTPAGQAMHLAVEHPVKRGLWRYGADFTLAAEGDVHTEDITRPAVARITLTVTHPDGRPWTGLAVYARDSVDTFFSHKGQTNSNGFFTVVDVAEGPFTMQLFNAGDGILLKEVQGTIAASDDLATLTLPVRIDSVQGQVSGRIYGADGTTAIPGAIVELVNVDDGKLAVNGRIVSDANGDYRFLNVVFSQGGFRVTAQSPWNSTISASATGSLVSEGEQAIRDLVLPVVIGSITGRVTTPGGEPVFGAQVAVGDASATTLAQAVTSASGEFRIDNYIAPTTGFAVSAARSGVIQQVQKTFAVQRDTIVADIVLPLRQASVRVRVVAADQATGVPQARVTVEGLNSVSLNSGYTDANGLMTLADLWVPLAGITLRADYNDGESIVTQAVATFDPATAIPVVMPMSVIRGRVTFADASAVEFPTVFTIDALGRTRMAATTGSGDFVVLNTAAGVFTATAQDSSSGLRARRDAEITDLATAMVLDIALPSTGRITGTLFDRQGRTIAEARVALSAEGLGFARETYTDSTGAFAFEDVPVGLASVYASAWVEGEGQNYSTAAGTVATGQGLVLDLHPVATTTVSGTLVRADGTPVNGGYVEISALGGASPSGYFRDDIGTDSLGNFSFANVPVGFVKLVGSDEGGSTFGVTYLNLTAGAGTGVTVTFGTGGAADYSLTDDLGTLIRISYDGALLNGVPAGTSSSNRPYNRTYESAVGSDTFCCDYVGGLSLAGRQLELGPLQVDNLFQTRKVFVPQGGGFVRYLEILENTLALPVTATVEMSAPLRVSSDRTRVAVAPGDTGNTYLLLSDTFGGRVPTAPVVGHVFAGAGVPRARASVTNAPVSGSTNYSSYQWTVTVPANGRVILMHFGVLAAPTDTAGAQSQALSLVDLSEPEALAGMTPEEKAAVRNFVIALPPGGGGQ